jgi:toxin FitB
MSYLIDTCVISELVAKRPNARVVAWVDGVDESLLNLSGITIGEIRKGVEKLPPSKRKTLLERWLNDDLLARFGRRILPLDTEAILTWGRLVGSLEAQGKRMAAIDSLIAATALHHQRTLVTRNENDFRHAGVTILNPWT